MDVFVCETCVSTRVLSSSMETQRYYNRNISRPNQIRSRFFYLISQWNQIPQRLFRLFPVPFAVLPDTVDSALRAVKMRGIAIT
eukprot:1765641-Rhodomonas_salina.3